MKIFEDYFPRVIYLVDFRDVTLPTSLFNLSGRSLSLMVWPHTAKASGVASGTGQRSAREGERG